MTVPAKLVAFAAALVVAGLLGAGLGAAVGPLGPAAPQHDMPTTDVPAHDAPTDEGPTDEGPGDEVPVRSAGGHSTPHDTEPGDDGDEGSAPGATGSSAEPPSPATAPSAGRPSPGEGGHG